MCYWTSTYIESRKVTPQSVSNVRTTNQKMFTTSSSNGAKYDLERHTLTVFILILTSHLQFEKEIPYPGWQTQIDWCWSGPWSSKVPKPHGCVFLLFPLPPHFFLPFYSEEICASLPHFVECDEMWYGNPSYNTPTFNSSSTINNENNFLVLVQ